MVFMLARVIRHLTKYHTVFRKFGAFLHAWNSSAVQQVQSALLLLLLFFSQSKFCVQTRSRILVNKDVKT